MAKVKSSDLGVLPPEPLPPEVEAEMNWALCRVAELDDRDDDRAVVERHDLFGAAYGLSTLGRSLPPEHPKIRANLARIRAWREDGDARFAELAADPRRLEFILRRGRDRPGEELRRRWLREKGGETM